MRFNFLSRFLFPRSVGLDIADRSVEVVELAGRASSPHITALGRVVLPQGVVERGLIKDRPALAIAVREALRGAETATGRRKKSQGISPRQVVFGLPDSQVYIHFFSCPWANVPKGDAALGAMVLVEAREHIPLEESDLIISYKVLGRTDTGLDFLVAGTSRKLLDDWQRFFTELGLTAEFDLETIATFRGIFPESVERPVMVIDCGAVTTMLAVFDKNGLRYSRTLLTGGESLTTAVAKTLKVDHNVAEEKKHEIGILDPESQIFTILLRELAPLKDEIKATIDHYERWSGQKIHGLLLTGGGSQLRGLADYLRSNLELPAGVARSPFVKQPIVYLEAIGLALGGLGKRGEDELMMRAGIHTGSGLGRQSSGFRWLRENRGLLAFIILLIVGVGLIFWIIDYRREIELRREAERRSTIEAIPVAPVSELIVDNIASSTPSTGSGQATEKTLKIADTPTGWLNVRSGPGTSFASLGRVNPGEVYPLLAEEGEWYRIQFSQDKEGWVAKQYTIINN